MWPRKKPKPEIVKPDYSVRPDYGVQIAELQARLADLDNTVNALIADNRVNRDIPDNIKVLLGQYRHTSRRIQKFEEKIQPVFNILRQIKLLTTGDNNND